MSKFGKVAILALVLGLMVFVIHLMTKDERQQEGLVITVNHTWRRPEDGQLVMNISLKNNSEVFRQVSIKDLVYAVDDAGIVYQQDMQGYVWLSGGETVTLESIFDAPDGVTLKFVKGR